jgi:hypothetical protein
MPCTPYVTKHAWRLELRHYVNPVLSTLGVRPWDRRCANEHPLSELSRSWGRPWGHSPPKPQLMANRTRTPGGLCDASPGPTVSSDRILHLIETNKSPRGIDASPIGQSA